MFNLGEYKDQDDFSTDQDIDSIGGTLHNDYFVQEIICNNEYRAEIGRVLFVAERSCPDALQAIMLMSDALFGANNIKNSVQTVNIQDANLDLGSHMYIPVQEQVSKLDTHYNMHKLLCGTQATNY